MFLKFGGYSLRGPQVSSLILHAAHTSTRRQCGCTEVIPLKSKQGGHIFMYPP